MSSTTEPLWQGHLVPRQLTLLAGWPKSGRTTLVLALLEQLRAGGELAGQPIRAGRALVVTDRPRQYRPAPHVQVAHAPLATDWTAVLHEVLNHIRRHAPDLVVLDGTFLFPPPHSLHDLHALRLVLDQLRALAAQGPAFLLVHLYRQRWAPPGRRAAGPALLCDEMDCVVELDYVTSRRFDDPRRRLAAYPRHDEPTEQLILFDRAAGRYTVPDPRHPAGPEPLQALLADADAPLTCRQILAAWPADRARPAPITLWRWLQRDLDLGQLERLGAGHRNQPHRYRLAATPSLSPAGEARADCPVRSPLDLAAPGIPCGSPPTITGPPPAAPPPQSQPAPVLPPPSPSKPEP